MSWKDNVEALGKTRRLYLIDTLGEGNRSELADVEKYPGTGREVADLYKEVTEQLGGPVRGYRRSVPTAGSSACTMPIIIPSG